MECSCEIDVDIGGDSPDFFNSNIVKAKKTHKCTECKREIPKGEEYEKVSGKWGGGIDVFKTCKDCLSLRNEFFTSYYFGRIWEIFSEHVDGVGASIPEACLSNLTPVARGRACDIIQDWWGDVITFCSARCRTIATQSANKEPNNEK